MTDPAHGLRIEHLDEPLGLLTRSPRMSWRLPTGAGLQLAYRIRTDNGWDTGWVGDHHHVLVPYAGPELRSAQRVTWRVQVDTDLGRSDWSEPAWFETGLLDAEDWTAGWIEPGRMPEGPAGQRPATLLRVGFDVARPVVSARLYATAHGVYEAFVNGHRAGDAELAPGFTQYDSRLQVAAIDVTDAVRPGANALGVILADGWYRGQIGITRSGDQWGTRTALLAQLHLIHDDGTTTVVGTGPDWRSSVGHIAAADLIAGEHVDLRRLPRGWDRVGFDGSGWDPVTPVAGSAAELVDSPAPQVRRVQEIIPVAVHRLENGRQIVDLGQNINGWVRLTDLGPAGTTITLRHAEWLGTDGDVTTDHLRPDLPFLPHPLPAGQVDSVVSAGRPDDVFEPRRTTHGFRYVAVDGHPGSLTPADVRGVVVHTDMRRTGWFSCSDERINRLHDAAVWSLRDNACDIPTDCPHRERAGWTGDWQLYVPTAAFLYDVAGFSTKWLRDVAADQWPDGTVANISPTAPAEGRHSPIAELNGSAGWGDAAVIVPWELYRVYGDLRILDELWPTMVRWLDRTERIAREQRHPDRVVRRPVPAPHEQYVWDSGFHWGEWLEPGAAVDDLDALAAADKGDVATAYYAHSARLMSRIAGLLGREADATRYRELADRVRAAWRAEYLGSDGRLTPDTQANHVRALAFDLVPTHLRAAVADRLAELVAAAGDRLGTGFLATPMLLPVLADTGHLDLAYRLLFSGGEPSWLTMIDRGATTIWEHWDGVDATGKPRESLNHYSKGAVISFLHRYTAGIQLVDDEPAYRRLEIRPRPGGGLTHVEAAHESPYGRIESTWSIVDDRLHLRVLVPAGTSAMVVLPDGETRVAGPGRHTYTSLLPASSVPATSDTASDLRRAG
jgi:alpha-L-rhamnosidase